MAKIVNEKICYGTIDEIMEEVNNYQSSILNNNDDGSKRLVGKGVRKQLEDILTRFNNEKKDSDSWVGNYPYGKIFFVEANGDLLKETTNKNDTPELNMVLKGLIVCVLDNITS